MGHREDFNQTGLAMFLPVYHTYFTSYCSYLQWQLNSSLPGTSPLSKFFKAFSGGGKKKNFLSCLFLNSSQPKITHMPRDTYWGGKVCSPTVGRCGYWERLSLSPPLGRPLSLGCAEERDLLPSHYLITPETWLGSSSSTIYQVMSDCPGLPLARILSSWFNLNFPLPLIFPLSSFPSTDPWLLHFSFLYSELSPISLPSHKTPLQWTLLE